MSQTFANNPKLWLYCLVSKPSLDRVLWIKKLCTIFKIYRRLTSLWNLCLYNTYVFGLFFIYIWNISHIYFLFLMTMCNILWNNSQFDNYFQKLIFNFQLKNISPSFEPIIFGMMLLNLVVGLYKQNGRCY